MATAVPLLTSDDVDRVSECTIPDLQPGLPRRTPGRADLRLFTAERPTGGRHRIHHGCLRVLRGDDDRPALRAWFATPPRLVVVAALLVGLLGSAGCGYPVVNGKS